MDSEPEYSIGERSATRPQVLASLSVSVSPRTVTQLMHGTARKTITKPTRHAKGQAIAKIRPVVPVFSTTGSENRHSRDSSVSDKQNQRGKSAKRSSSREPPANAKRKLRPRSKSQSEEKANVDSTSTQPKGKESRSKSSTPTPEQSWEVKRIVGKKWLKEHKEYGYHVEWVGDWPLSWEPKSLLEGSQDAIREFEDRQEKRKKAKESQDKKLSLKKRARSGKGGKKSQKNSLEKKKQQQQDAHDINLLEKDYEMSVSPSEEVFQKAEAAKLKESSEKNKGKRQKVAKEEGSNYVEIVQPGYSAMELSDDVHAVRIIAHKPKQLHASALHELDFLVNYSAGPNEFVPYEVCLVNIPAHLCEYLAITPIIFRGPKRSH